MFAYFEATLGISGDMCLGALVDCGANLGQIKEQLQKLPLSGWDMQAEKIQTHGIAATRVRVSIPHEHAHRHLHTIKTIIEQAQWPADITTKCIAIFENLARAEAKVHGTDMEEVHFHEVGAMDAILDVCGAVWALAILGVKEIRCSPIALGHGMIRCAHGLLPLPAPAVLKLVENIPLAPDLPQEGELCTPTGAAIITTLASSFGARPTMNFLRCGFGAGTSEFPWPNVLRVHLAQNIVPDTGWNYDQVAILNCNLDDCNPEWLGYLAEKLFAAGALDFYTLPAAMKKNRPGLLLEVICHDAQKEEMARLLFTHTTTSGVRLRSQERYVLPRRFAKAVLPWGEVRVKINGHGLTATCAPEYEDCKKIAEQSGLPLKTIYAAAYQTTLDKE